MGERILGREESRHANSSAVTISACPQLAESRRPPCPNCQMPMEPEHAHHKCPGCGYIEPCCGW